MTTFIGKESTVKELLKDLIELDFDAIEAYQAAIDRLETQDYKIRLQEFMEDHERHTRDLSIFLQEMCEEAPTKGNMKRILTKGKVLISQIMGDRGMLMAMKDNEEDTNTAYERAASRNNISTPLTMILEKNLADERRHRSWLESTIEYLKKT